MKLYASLTSPYARKVRICLQEKGLDYELVVEAPSDPTANVARLNPLGKVPLLQCDDGEVVFNSPMIVDYIDGLGGTALIPVTTKRLQVQRWQALGDGIIDAVVARMLELRRDPEHQDAAVIQKQQAKVAAAMDFADKHYKGGEFLEKDQFSLADIALAVALEYVDFRYPHDWRSSHPSLAQWLSTINQRPSFLSTVAQE